MRVLVTIASKLSLRLSQLQFWRSEKPVPYGEEDMGADSLLKVFGK